MQKYSLSFLLGTLVIAAGVLFSDTLPRQPQALRLVFLDVGQGDAILIQTPGGRNVVIDTGPANNLSEKIDKYTDLNHRSIDLLVLTHPDLDHIGGTLSLMKNYKVLRLMHSGLLAGAELYGAIAALSEKQKIPTLTAGLGQILRLDKDVYLELYGPSPGFTSFEPNEYSVIARLVYGESSALLTGDAPLMIEQDLVAVYGEKIASDILKIGHHGSKTSTGDFFLAAVEPTMAIISAGCKNRFGHPHPDVLARLFVHQLEVFDTCNDGDIVFESTGSQWIHKK